METIRTPVVVPALVTARTPRSRRGHTGWAWIPTRVDVPLLKSEERVMLLDPADWTAADPTLRSPARLEGACAGGAHWRTPSAAVPFARRAGAREAVPTEGTEVFWSTCEKESFGAPTDVPHPFHAASERYDDGTGERLRKRAFSAACSHDVTQPSQASFRRATGRRDDPTVEATRLTTRFRLREDVAWCHLEPDLFEDMVALAAQGLAVVDGVVMERSAPPRRLLIEDRPKRIRLDERRPARLVTVSGYVDTAHALGTDFVDLPFGAPWSDDVEGWVVAHDGPYPGFDLVDLDVGVLDGAVVTPPDPFEAVPRHYATRADLAFSHLVVPRDGYDRAALRDTGTRGREVRERLSRVVGPGGDPRPASPYESDTSGATLKRLLWVNRHVLATYDPNAALPPPPQEAPDVLDALADGPGF